MEGPDGPKLARRRGSSHLVLLTAILIFGCVSAMPWLTEGNDQLLPLNGTLFGLVRALLGVLVLLRLSALRWPVRQVLRQNAPLLGFVLYAGASLLWTSRESLPQGGRLLVHLAVGIGGYFLAALSGGRRRAAILLAIVLASGLLLSATGAMTRRAEVSELGVSGDLDRSQRLAGVFGSPNVLATQLALAMAVGISLVVTSGVRRSWKVSSWVVVAASAYPFILTLSRSGWIGLGLAGCLIVVLTRQWWLLVLATGAAAVLLQSSIGSAFLGDWRQAATSDVSSLAGIEGYQNVYGRVVTMWQPALEALSGAWQMAFGHGAGTAQTWAVKMTEQPMHSELLQNWFDLGSVGVILLVTGLGAGFVRNVWLYHHGASPLMRAAGLAGAAAQLVVFPKFLWDHILIGPNAYFFLILVGLGNGLYAEQRQTALMGTGRVHPPLPAAHPLARAAR